MSSQPKKREITASVLPTGAATESTLALIKSILSGITSVPSGKNVTKIEFGEDANGNIKEIKFYDGAELLFTLTFSNAGAVASTWDITRS